MERIDIHGLCKWTQADTRQTLKAHGLDNLFATFGIGAWCEELFGQVPETYVFKGDIKRDEPLLLDAKGNGVYVIDGSVDVRSAFTYYTADAYTVLVITGDLHAGHYVQAWDTQLVVLGTTTIDGLLHINVSDAGFALFRGPVTSKDRVISSSNVASDVPMFAKKPKGRIQELVEDAGEPYELHDKLVRGGSVFVPPLPKGSAKRPSNAELAKMTIAEVLTIKGFSKMQFEGEAVNPNWFAKGNPGCAVESVSIAKAYVDMFPDELASMKELVLLALDDGKRLDAMLRSLPKLRSLERLRISNCKLDRLPAEIGALEQLEVLELCNNKSLTTLPVVELNKLAKLRKLWVTDNAIAVLPSGLELERIPEVHFDEQALQLGRKPS
jgi:hypothetical protein